MTQLTDPKHPIDEAKASWAKAVTTAENQKFDWLVKLLKKVGSYQGKEVRQGSVFLEFGATQIDVHFHTSNRAVLEMTFLHRIDSVFLQATVMQSELYQLQQKGTIGEYRTNLVSGGVLWTISEKKMESK